jgi:UDP:flavonoid glycosyltransferase YjiC (YdhE family)
MARILFAWEFGANPGHLAQLLPLAVRFRAKGHKVVFALSDVTRAEAVLGERGFEYLQAPVWRRRPQRSSLIPCNYSEILQQYGYADREGLIGPVKAWREIYRLIDPQVVLFEHAPTALLASRGFEAVRVLYGVGFCSPPRVTPFPNFRSWENVPRARLEESDAQVLDTMNGVLEKLHLRPLGAAHELFDVDDEFLCTFPEIDHYAGRIEGPYCGPVFTRDEGAEPTWPAEGNKRVYVYLSPEMRAFPTIAEMLSDGGHSVLWVAPGITDETVHRYQSRRLKFMREPLRLSDIAASADAAVLHGGHGTVSAMLLAGMPMAMFPMALEQTLLARKVAQLGAGTMALPHAAGHEIRQSLESVLEDPRFREKARAFASRYERYDPQAAVARISRCVARYCRAAKS